MVSQTQAAIVITLAVLDQNWRANRGRLTLESVQRMIAAINRRRIGLGKNSGLGRFGFLRRWRGKWSTKKLRKGLRRTVRKERSGIPTKRASHSYRGTPAMRVSAKNAGITFSTDTVFASSYRSGIELSVLLENNHIES